MKYFYVITNELKDPAFEVTHQIQTLLHKKGAVCVVCTECDAIPNETECILVLGGDGTLLRAARDTVGKNIPLIGVNLGTLGFMAEVEKQHLEAALDALLENRFTLKERMMLVGCIPIHEADGKEKLLKAHALNDVVVARQGGLKILPYDVYVNGQYLTRYQADGVIIATPTGSTGYNMSAGGPIVEPEAKLILLTPICPHTLSPRSIILSAEDTIEILIGYGRNGEVLEASVNFDGSAEHILQSGDCIRVSQSGQTTSLATIRQSGFLENLHRKMNG
jgi:NAD+ kinase